MQTYKCGTCQRFIQLGSPVTKDCKECAKAYKALQAVGHQAKTTAAR